MISYVNSNPTKCAFINEKDEKLFALGFDLSIRANCYNVKHRGKIEGNIGQAKQNVVLYRGI